MKKYALWFLLLIPIYAAIVVRCTPSLHPIYSDSDIIYDPALIGTWQPDDPDATWILDFKSADDANRTYVMTFTDGENETWGTFVAHLAKIRDHIFLDAYPKLEDADANDARFDLLLPTHIFALVEQIEPDLTLRDMNDDWLNSYLAENPNALAHEFVQKEGEPEPTLVLTASTEELQAFVIQHIQTEGAYDESSYHRVNEAAESAEE